MVVVALLTVTVVTHICNAFENNKFKQEEFSQITVFKHIISVIAVSFP